MIDPHEERRERTSKTVKCPWCTWTGDEEEYPDHLQRHYKKDGEKLVGPYPKLEPEEE